MNSDMVWELSLTLQEHGELTSEFWHGLRIVIGLAKASEHSWFMPESLVNGDCMDSYQLERKTNKKDRICLESIMTNLSLRI